MRSLGGCRPGCFPEKNCTLIRHGLIQGFRQLYEEAKDEKVKTKALELIDTEADAKYRQTYARVCRSG
jgi:hypothetical protein